MNFIHIFLITGGKNMSINNVTVDGGGVLRSQIAFQRAFCGFNVTLWLRSKASIERTQPKIDRLKELYLNTVESMKTNPSAYCRGFTDEIELSNTQIDEFKAKNCCHVERKEDTGKTGIKAGEGFYKY